MIGFYSRNLPILLSTLLCPLNYTRSGCRHWASAPPCSRHTPLSSACLLLLLPFHFSTLRLRLWLAAALPARRTISGDRALPSPLSLSNTSPQAPSHCRNNTLSRLKSHPPHTNPLQTHCLLFPLLPLPSSSLLRLVVSHTTLPFPQHQHPPLSICPSPLPLPAQDTPLSQKASSHIPLCHLSLCAPREVGHHTPTRHTQQRTHNEDTRKHLGMPPHPQMPAPRVFPVSLPPPPSLQTLPPLTTHAQQPVGVRVRL